MEVKLNRIDDANISVTAKITKDDIESKISILAKEAGKQIKVDGFRKGKVPVHVVKAMYGEKLEQDAEGEAVREVLDHATKELEIKADEILGQPLFKKYDKTEDGIDVEVEISLKPNLNLEGYLELLPAYEKPIIDDEARDKRVADLVEAQAPLVKIEQDRALEHNDTVVMDFEGSIDGVPFDGGAAKGFSLKIGSGQFIPGFEDQMIGMEMNVEKIITVPFPENYHNKDLAGKESQFKVTVTEIQQKVVPELNDELAAKLLQGVENATVEMVKERVVEQMQREEISRVYNNELKPKIVEAFVRHYTFALPNTIVEQEIDAKINDKARLMSEEELNSYREDSSKVDALRDEVRGDAEDSVRATFIIDAIARKESITVSDDEVSQTIYYEAMMSGQNPQQIIKYYQENNLLPAIKMGIIEDKLFAKLLGLDS